MIQQVNIEPTTVKPVQTDEKQIEEVDVNIKFEKKYKESLNDFFIYLETLENILNTITVQDKQKEELKNLIKEIKKFKTENENDKNIEDVVKKFIPVYKKIKKWIKYLKDIQGVIQKACFLK